MHWARGCRRRLLGASKDAEMHLKRGVQHLQSVIDTTDASWREELQRTSADHDVKRDRAHAALQGPSFVVAEKISLGPQLSDM